MIRIVTGHNKEGKSIINIDGPPARTLGEDVGGLFELWNTDGKDVNSLDTIDRADSEVILSPPNGGTKFRYFQINPLPEGVSAEAPSNTELVLSSVDKQLLGDAASKIRSFRPPEPYKGKGVKYADERIIRKESKKA